MVRLSVMVGRNISALNIHVSVRVPCKQLLSNVFTCICCIYLYYTIHSLSLLVSQCNVSIQVVCTVPDVMVGMIAGKMPWPAVTVREDIRVKRTKSLTLTFFN